MPSRRTPQLGFEFENRRRSGRRPKPGRRVVHHVKRPMLPANCPAHVTLRVRGDVPSLRNRRFIREFRATLRQASERGRFRVCHYSLQRDHVHLVVETSGKEALGRGMKAVSARLARAVHRVFDRRGPVLLGRYHLRPLRTPREVRNALSYVLLNARKHWRQRRGSAPPPRLDVASSGRWFDGWRCPPPRPERVDRGSYERDVARPQGWLLAKGWRRHGLVDPTELPGLSQA